ncbi:hypothetical protein GCM10025857_34010 [Alicyclobacillus contaminans]|uniref:hypothetical protein n=1 Tax=Alicyclobacillus contaminans TaxID=392016 RepID=UPI0004117472|nr:hypothetical protein [Alicyclobacillus contaminans]GMA52044.1 hypothetical protein GCM10025857_34010 [Alicyclobacillus contaminans]
MTKKEIMQRAHQLAKQMVGDYTARFVLGLRQAWREAKRGACPHTDRHQHAMTFASGHTFVGCSECIRRERAIEAEKLRQATAARWGIQVQALQGSPKQIAWAEDIRAKALEWLSATSEKDVQASIQKLARRTGMSTEQAAATLRQRVATLLGTSSARHIIDHRSMMGQGMLYTIVVQTVAELRGEIA